MTRVVAGSNPVGHPFCPSNRVIDSSDTGTEPSPFRYEIRHNLFPKFKDRAFIINKYAEENLSTAEIARQCGCARSTVLKYLGTENLEGRKKRRFQDAKSQPAFGERVIKGRIIRHKKEEELLRQLIELRKGGKSYRQISSWLSRHQIRSKNGCETWDPSVVRRVLLRAQKPATQNPEFRPKTA